MELETELVRLCMEAACDSRESVEKWRRQKRSLERLPSHLADSLLRRLLSRRLIFPSLLEVFKHNAEEIDLRGDNSVDAEWMAYIGGFRYLRSLNLADCHRLTSSALWAITGMSSLKELDLSRCAKVNDAGIRHIVSISTLEKFCISETGVTADGVKLLSSLKNLSVLDLGGLPVTDLAISSLQVLRKLQYLDLWGSEISDQGASVLRVFSNLSFLNVAWTKVRNLPNLSSLEFLNMSNCTIESIFEGEGDKAPLAKLLVSGATFVDGTEALVYIETSCLSHLDLSHSSLHKFSFLSHLKALEHLDLSSSTITDDSIEEIACVGEKLKYLNLSNTKVSSAGVSILAGHVPNIDMLLLSHTAVDDDAISYISLMPSLKAVDLSYTNIKGVIQHMGSESDPVLSLKALQSLVHLQKLNLEQTQVRDTALSSLSTLQELRHLSLRSTSLTDTYLYHISSLPKLANLSIRDAVLTNRGLESFEPPKTLRMIDLRGCWLLTEDALVEFCKCHPQIEVKHDDFCVYSSNELASSRQSPSRFTSKTSRSHQEGSGEVPISPCFIDQRLKYSREELLALQYSSVSIPPPHSMIP